MSTASIVAPTGADGILDDRLTLVDTVAEFGARLEAARAAGRTVGLVPTMGALHDGHRSLVERAAAECDLVAVTVFVNPLQFGNPDDLDHYPRTLEADSAVVADAGGHLLFAPALTEMYPDFPAPVHTSVGVVGVSEAWEGASRPGHFDGVSTVVSKLFAMAGRCRAYFGEKDFQQLAVVRTMARDLSFPVEVIGCSTVRDPDGLALSSRNVRLAPEERRAALVLHRALRAGAAAVSAGQLGVPAIEAEMARLVAEEPLVDLDYAVLVDAGDLTPSTVTDRPQRLLIAAQVGPVRLIDNLDPRQAVPSPQFRVTKGTN
ncbi:MAG TPA: pantoate--beta-alanine ligase [Acidimicrobiales bacterium]|nr:pantoate--beta-alanine ligase [Acidimicrobiales bacterium]